MKTILFILVAFLALSTVVAALLLMSVPDGSLLSLTTDILKGSVFKDFVLPGLLLMIFVGVINLLALFYNLINHKLKYNLSIAGGAMILVWMVIQYSIIQQAFWLDLVYVLVGLSVIFISLQLKGKYLM
jgi:hypothetical protein